MYTTLTNCNRSKKIHNVPVVQETIAGRGKEGGASDARQDAGSPLQRKLNTMHAQQATLVDHVDAITCLQLAEYPFPILFAGDRSGVLKIFA